MQSDFESIVFAKHLWMRPPACSARGWLLVLLNGSAVAVNWAQDHVPAIVEAWYPGQAAGTAIADVLFGDYNPGGRLPVTFYKSITDLPAFDDYRMAGRTYRFFRMRAISPACSNARSVLRSSTR